MLPACQSSSELKDRLPKGFSVKHLAHPAISFSPFPPKVDRTQFLWTAVYALFVQRSSNFFMMMQKNLHKTSEKLFLLEMSMLMFDSSYSSGLETEIMQLECHLPPDSALIMMY